MFKLVIFVVFLACFARGGDVCGKATVSQKKVYITTERRLSEDTAFVVNFNLQCASGEQGNSLFAEVGGKIYPVTKSPEGNVYQLSWVAPQSSSPSGTCTVRFFDDEGVNTFRKAVRNEEDTSALKPLFDVEVAHPGNSVHLWITSESVGLVLAGLMYYAVCQLRNDVVN